MFVRLAPYLGEAGEQVRILEYVSDFIQETAGYALPAYMDDFQGDYVASNPGRMQTSDLVGAQSWAFPHTTSVSIQRLRNQSWCRLRSQSLLHHRSGARALQAASGWRPTRADSARLHPGDQPNRLSPRRHWDHRRGVRVHWVERLRRNRK